IQKVWCIPPPDTWFLRLILSKMVSVTKKMMSIGVRQILAGLPDIHTLFMARYSTEQQRFCLKEFPIILMPGVFGKPSKSTKSLSFIPHQQRFVRYRKKVQIGLPNTIYLH